MVDAWAGMRGAVSLAAALALPGNFPQRDLLIFLTFAVIFVTLVLQGLTLPPLIRWLGVIDDGTEEEHEDLKARLRRDQGRAARGSRSCAPRSGRATTRSSACSGCTSTASGGWRRAPGKIEDEGFEDRSFAYQTIVREVLEAQRAEIVRLRNEGTISNEVMHRIERELDLEDERLEI